ncbi:hypothetical protein [Zooshikella ganghwensis]|uniref:hypothetical protein n=1 Tax=Zooshikella ganghwensis TaxID=202772 RepID=UPI0003F9339F|nr:hypothetical protein [Zooshikella ganghwensis]
MTTFEHNVLNNWNDLNWKHNFLDEVVRHLSKTGDLEAYFDILNIIKKTLSEEETVEIYRRLQSSKRPTFEWKDDFIKIFSITDQNILPPPIMDEEEARKKMVEGRKKAEEKLNEELSSFKGDINGDIPF